MPVLGDSKVGAYVLLYSLLERCWGEQCEPSWLLAQNKTKGESRDCGFNNLAANSGNQLYYHTGDFEQPMSHQTSVLLGYCCMLENWDRELHYTTLLIQKVRHSNETAILQRYVFSLLIESKMYRSIYPLA